MIRRPPRSTHCISSAASDVYKRQFVHHCPKTVRLTLVYHILWIFSAEELKGREEQLLNPRIRRVCDISCSHATIPLHFSLEFLKETVHSFHSRALTIKNFQTLYVFLTRGTTRYKL
eukprot:TRINITY_DN3613_c0_g1_i17.p1 TRINITY_DN3613_c0_g1~~TRINITY_DN3613_c0_g1_i17.p1  ORF type:complete len:132 (-),score=32.84 TRINITY_DN3613_c0_g1_i17:183-533(-)